MKTEFKAKFIQHLSQKEREEGFTLIELLVVIIIIGILAAIALPSFLNQAAKARQSEAKNAVGAVMRAQQSYRLENSTFAGNFSELEVGLPTATDNYNYSIDPSTGTANSTVIKAEPNGGQSATLKAYAGLVEVSGTTGQTAAGACQTKTPSATAPSGMSLVNSVISCAAADEPMK
ncbi:Type IV pilin PilA [Geitlerinema sp. FC II]|nr:Type IV pilin PilA [Geitlerinema sp. FC II]